MSKQRCRDYMAARRADRKSRGLCYRCDNPARPGGLLCVDHRKEVTLKERPSTAPHLPCLVCGVINGKEYCPEHREEATSLKAKASEVERVEASLAKKDQQRQTQVSETPEQARLRIKEVVRRALTTPKKETPWKPKVVISDPVVIPDTPLTHMLTTVRLDAVLTRFGITTYQDLYKYTEQDFLNSRNFGRRSFDCLRQHLKSKGLPALPKVRIT